MGAFADFSAAVWRPDADRVAGSQLARLMRLLGARDVEALHAYALQEPAAYYRAVLEQLRLEFRTAPQGLVDNARGDAFPRWFPGGEMNLVDTCLRDEPDRLDQPAVVVLDEAGSRETLTYRELRTQVQYLATYLRDAGVRAGDCVGLYLPMRPEATVAFFACAWLGAIAVPAFSGYGPDALASRLEDCAARILITATGFQRRGAWVDMAAVAEAARARTPGVEKVICVGASTATLPGWSAWSDCLARGAAARAVPAAGLDPNHPVLLVYTSGTSGRPKGIVHSHAGLLVKVASDYALAFDVQQGDRVCWITDLGWLVGPQMIVGNAALGSTAVYYLGALDEPDWDQLWRLCAAERVTLVGVSPSAVRGMAAASPTGPAHAADLRALRTFASTGEAWDSTAWRWLFERVGGGALPIVNYSGGTEIAGGILTSYATLPMQDCAFTGPVIGMDADIIYPDGPGSLGAVGELVVRNTWPGMTHSFWGGADELYLDTYWREYPGVWRHGDLAARDAAGWWYVRGRSDDTLKVAGRRVGPAEIEAALLETDAVLEAAVVGVPDAMKGQSIVAFVVAQTGRALDVVDLKQQVRARLGASLVPNQILKVDALPKTRNGKIVRRAILARYLGKPAGDLSTLESQDALMAIPQAGPETKT